jgi:Xaa-Pro aminopeptidase
MTTTGLETTSIISKNSPLEKVGEGYSIDQMFKVRGMTRAAIHEIAARVKPGMVEEEAVEMARDILAEAGMFRGWHDVYVRFGTNTTKTFGAASDPGVVLGADDIFLIDIGPVFEKWEGDGGDTFVTGTDRDKARCAGDARALFHIVRRKWEAEKATGRALYAFAVAEARRMGWELNMDLSGHRISEFPHEAHHPGPLADVDFTPSAGPLWVLEIHVRHPTEKYGAFYEDMLLDDSYFPDFKA